MGAGVVLGAAVVVGGAGQQAPNSGAPEKKLA